MASFYSINNNNNNKSHYSVKIKITQSILTQSQKKFTPDFTAFLWDGL